MTLAMLGILALGLGLVVFGLVFGIRELVRRVRWRGGCCAWCGYDLGERSGLRCPECGHEKDVRIRRANLRLARRLVVGAVLPMVLGLLVVNSLGVRTLSAMCWSVMPDGVVIRSSFGDSPSLLARRELERRMRPMSAGGFPVLRHMYAPIDAGAFTPEQWERIATAILEDIERIDARPLGSGSQGLLPHAEWLLYIPADADRIRDRIAELFEHGGDRARRNAHALIDRGDSLFPPPDPRRWEMGERLCPLLVETMLTDPHRFGHQVASNLFYRLCPCHWESIERYLREATDELVSLPNHHPTRFMSFMRVQTQEDIQGLFLFVERMRDEDDANIQRFRHFFDRAYAHLRQGQFGQVRHVNGVIQDERWYFVPKTRAELEGEALDGVDDGEGLPAG